MAAAVDDSGSKAREVADYSTAKSDQMVASLDFVGQQAIDHRPEPVPALALLAGWNEDRLDRHSGEAVLKAAAENAPDIFVADHQKPAATRKRRQMSSRSVDEAMLDQHVVRIDAERDLDPCHSASRIARGGGASGRQGPAPSLPRRSERRGCRRTDRAVPGSRSRSRCRGGRWSALGSGSKTSA